MLYKRIIEEGTINEPEGKPEPQFALPSTVNWMRALAMIVEDAKINFGSAEQFYQGEGRRTMDSLVENTVLEQLFLSLHHLSALESMKSFRPAADYGRIGILAWYYGVANAAAAMTAARNGSFQEDHAGTARMWDSEIAARGLAMDPFGWRVSSLVEATYKPEIRSYRGSSTATLQEVPGDVEDARAAAASYLSGSAKWYAWKTTEDVRKTAEFKALKVDNFRTKPARQLRDGRFEKRSVGFIHQAARYRGKANYREALFLAYGANAEALLIDFVAHQATVLRAFLSMAGAYSRRKLGKSLFSDFVADVETNRAFSLSPSAVFS